MGSGQSSATIVLPAGLAVKAHFLVLQIMDGLCELSKTTRPDGIFAEEDESGKRQRPDKS
jgi:hypothetical protein